MTSVVQSTTATKEIIDLQFVIDKQGNQDVNTENQAPDRIIYQRDTNIVLSPRKRKFSSSLHSTEIEEDVIELATTTCFNCEGPHNMKECPYPINKQVVSANRRQFLMDKPNDKRYWEEDIRTKFEVGVLTPQLKAALGIDESQDPPYLARMFQHGFPPAYTKPGNVNPFYAKYQAMINEADEWYQQLTPQTTVQHTQHYQNQSYYAHYNQQQYYYQYDYANYQTSNYESINYQSNPHDTYPRTTYEAPTKREYTPVKTSSSSSITPSKVDASKSETSKGAKETEEHKKKAPVQEELEEGEILF